MSKLSYRVREPQRLVLEMTKSRSLFTICATILMVFVLALVLGVMGHHGFNNGGNLRIAQGPPPPPDDNSGNVQLAQGPPPPPDDNSGNVQLAQGPPPPPDDNSGNVQL